MKPGLTLAEEDTKVSLDRSDAEALIGMNYACRMIPAPTTAQLRAYAAARTLWKETSLQSALGRLGFVQADPIRAPARAQDLILRQRVQGYRAGELERRYAELDVEEDMLPNYGFVTHEVHRLLHPRTLNPRALSELNIEQAAPGLGERVLEYVLAQGEAHPRQLEAEFGKTRVGNYWGGSSNAATRSLEALHHRGHLRVLRREKGVKVYAPARVPVHEPLSVHQRARGIVELLVRLYAPLPRQSLGYLISLCGYGAPGLQIELRQALKELEDGWLASSKADGLMYLWPADESLDQVAPAGVRLLAPFDPLVWDRRRFEHLHGWAYRFEAYTPPAKRVMGYYALPLFQAEKAVGWANLKITTSGAGGGELVSDIGLIPGVRRTASFEKALNAELDRFRVFLGLD
jgi:uncharacterized protein